MQFEPATWRAYGMGGDIHSAADAILGAANYLRASGSPRNTAHALYAYNPSHRYVAAVLAYARVMRSDPLGFATLYSWEASLPSTVGG
jgi:membrane-bound lytic murein transglycosylase B